MKYANKNAFLAYFSCFCQINLLSLQPVRIQERHRHRYELNHAYQQELEENGLICSGINPDSGLTEIIELQDHPWFIGTQFHPEYSSTVLHPHPLFLSFMQTLVTKK